VSTSDRKSVRSVPRARKDREYVAGLEKGLAIIEAFGTRYPRLTLTEAAQLTRLSRASARRCLLTLAKLGYAGFDGRYFRLAPRVLRLGHAYLSASNVAKIAQPVLESISERIHESASVAILDGAEAVFIARSTARQSLSIGLSVGTRLPAYCSATGRVLLAALPDAGVMKLLGQAELRKLTPKTVVDAGQLLKEIRRARAQGYAIVDEELEIGLRSIAVPVRDSTGDVVAAMSLAVRAQRMAREQMAERLLPALEAGRRAFAAAL
jgi:IclR family pca regulon transcriptional regulator